MSRTTKDMPFRVLKDRGIEMDYWFDGARMPSNFRKGRKQIKREGNKRVRARSFSEKYHGRCPFYDTKTVRTNAYFF